MLTVKTYPKTEFQIPEILRYAGGGSDEKTLALLNECIKLCRDSFDFRVCYDTFSVSKADGILDLSYAKVKSDSLSKYLENTQKIVLFAATVGLEIDRLITRYSRTDTAKALMLQAIGAERIESLCDMFCEDIKNEYPTLYAAPRFSPGYGDFPLENQLDIFRVLDCPRKIGLSLSESLLMTPSKSVTAIISLKRRN